MDHYDDQIHGFNSTATIVKTKDPCPSDAKSDIPLGFLLPASAFDVKPHFILITLVYKTTYFMLPLYVINLIVHFGDIAVGM